MERKGFGFCFICMLLITFFASQEVVMMAEAKPRVCQSQSHGFHGACASNHNCALVCRNEGFTGGTCRGLRRRCYCTKLC
uniref:Knottins-like domain-containing protein n=1 Tax=Kalanchoe fedtschenkoi TaxID=63787 RepID=A0A7N0TPW1_KALFE